jgi:hypothetical protein
VRLREEDRSGDERLVAMLRETDLMAGAAGDALRGPAAEPVGAGASWGWAEWEV